MDATPNYLLIVTGSVTIAITGMAIALYIAYSSKRERAIRNEAEKTLKESENQFRAISDSALDAVILMDSTGKICYWNKAAERIFGYSTKEALGCEMHALIMPQHLRNSYLTRFEQHEQASKGSLGGKTLEKTAVRKGGTKFPVELSIAPILLRGSWHTVGTIRDITQRKQALNDLKESHDRLRSLAARIEELREAERLRIARDIHDDLGQALLTLNADISWVKTKMPANQVELLEKVDAILASIKAMVESIRRISRDLRPSMLGRLGLSASIEWFMKDLQSRTGLDCTLSLPPDTLELDEKLAIALFRVIQETLANVVRHADATWAEVKLEEKGGQIMLVIRDNGKGITKAQIEASDSFGLIGMRERVFPWGGELHIEGHRGIGTTMTVIIPDMGKRGAA